MARIGLGGAAADAAVRTFTELAALHAERFPDGAPSRAWWVPGRIEVLGKHTDYGGGRSLLCAVERGFHVIAAPRPDAVVRLVDGSTGSAVTIPLAANADPRPSYWTDYPITVARRIGRDFPGARRGMNAVIRSSLPSASGLSSSSALVIACFLPLAAFNELSSSPEWLRVIDSNDTLAEYVGAVENGRAFRNFPADRGVGTQGGSEDQTAILCAVPDHLLQYHFIPVTREATVALPSGWRFVIAMSGVHAAKGAAMQARYNALAEETHQLLVLWRAQTGREDASLFGALQSAPDAGDHLATMIATAGPAAAGLEIRLAQFRAECEIIIPAVSRYLAAGDVGGIGELVARSQALAESALRNQVPETIHLAHRATALGAAAASAFGAGFGGSVWALVRAKEADTFRSRWQEDYVARFPHRRARAVFFASAAAPPAQEL